MDMQGIPIGSTNQGMKNTSDPATNNPTTEGAGAVASDSLAAESQRSGGAFASNRGAEPSGVSGSSSTFATTDTSAATTLSPAPDTAEREAKSAWNEAADGLRGPGGAKYAEGVGGQPELRGATNAAGYAGGPSDARTETDPVASGVGALGGRSSEGFSSSAGGGSEGYAGAAGGGGKPRALDDAPTYVASVVGVGGGKPKGANLTEGGFEGEAKNNDAEVGSENDPGRAALLGTQSANAGAAGGTGPVQKEVDNQTGYDALGSEERA